MGFIHVVNQGECLNSLAARFGFSRAELLYEHEKNSELRKRRPNLSLLRAGDEVFIPDILQKEVECSDGQEHAFTVRLPKTTLRIVLRDPTGNPYSNKRFVLEVDGIELEGTTDGQGLLDKPIPAQAVSGRLKLFVGPTPEDVLLIPLELGGLDPFEELSGVQGRLANLGYPCNVTGEMDELTEQAIRRFQRERGLAESGELDGPTKDALAKEVGG